MSDEDRRAAVEHQDALLAVNAIIHTPSGKKFIKYLFKSLDVCELPELGFTGELLHEKLGFLRAGNSIFKIVAEANHEVAAVLISEIEKEKHEKLYAEHKNGQSE